MQITYKYEIQKQFSINAYISPVTFSFHLTYLSVYILEYIRLFQKTMDCFVTHSFSQFSEMHQKRSKQATEQKQN